MTHAQEAENVVCTPEWSYRCPKCDRSCLARIKTLEDEQWRTRCSSCNYSYNVIPRMSHSHNEQPIIAQNNAPKASESGSTRSMGDIEKVAHSLSDHVALFPNEHVDKQIGAFTRILTESLKIRNEKDQKPRTS